MAKGQLTVDTAHLLGNHDSRGTVVGAPDSRDGEAVPQTLEVARTGGFLKLLLVDDIGVVVVPGGDDVVGSQAAHRSESLGNLAVLHEPTGRLGAEVDTNAENEGRDKGRTELETPRDGASVLDNNVGAETQKDTCKLTVSK